MSLSSGDAAANSRLADSGTLDGLPVGDFERVVTTLVDTGDEPMVVAAGRYEATLFFRRALGGVQISVLRYVPEAIEELRARIQELVKGASEALEIVLVGGGPDARRLLKRPLVARHPTRFLHLGEQEGQRGGLERVAPWVSGPGLASKLLAELDVEVHVTAASWQHIVALAAEGGEEIAEQIAEVRAFGETIQARKPYATWGVVALIGAVFAIELAVGGPGSVVVLSRLGGLVPAKVGEGELWRLISCTFLHGGWQHVLLNAYVLWVLGTFLERIIGSARFLLLYALTAIAGSLGSLAMLNGPVSIGASGAIWGLLGAHAALAYRDRGLLPAGLIPGARKAALINLGINVLVSFLPNVDLWAHFAGGAAGIALFASGLIPLGLPRLGQLEPGGAELKARVPTPPWLWALAGLGALTLISGLALGLIMGRPLQLRDGPTLVEMRLPKLGIALKLPQGAKRRDAKSKPGGSAASTAGASPEVVFGDPLSEPLTIGLMTQRLTPPLAPTALEGELVALKKKLKPPPEAKELEAPHLFRVDKHRGVLVRYRYPSRMELERAFCVIDGSLLIRMELYRWPGFRLPFNGRAAGLLESVKQL